MTKLNDIFESDVGFAIDEADSTEVDGRHVLAKLKGSFFVPDGMSRNKRYYPKSVWEKQLSKDDVRSKISDKRMLGTISHEQPINDTAVLEGKVSHTMTKLEIQNGQGYGEALILNTPAGQVLNTLARAGVKLFTSSRANGTYKGEYEGAPSVNPETYQLEGFDFVLDPGFLQASPQLAESVSESIEELKTFNDGALAPSNSNSEESTIMDKELVESLVKENGSLKSDLKLALKESEELKENHTAVSDENVNLKERLDKLEDQSEKLKAYQELGLVEDIKKTAEETAETVKAFEALGTVEEIEAALTMSKEKLEAYKELGTPETVREALERGKELILEYKDLGSPTSIKEVFDRTSKMIEEGKVEKSKQRVKDLAEELKVSEELIGKVAEKMEDDEIRDFVKSLGESVQLQTKYRKSSLSESRTEDTEAPKTRVTQKSSGARIFERFAK